MDRKLLLDQWTHVAFTFDSGSLRLFINGEAAANHQLDIRGPAAEFGGIVIGGHRTGTGRNFDGWIDDVSIWQRLLSPGEIRQLSRLPQN